MKIIRIANNFVTTDNIERYMTPIQVSEYRDLSAYFDSLVDKYVKIMDKEDLKDISWINKKDAIERKVQETQTKLRNFKAPFLKKMEESKVSRREERDAQEKRTKELFDKSQNNSKFQRVVERSVKNWPRTNDIRFAGYIMQDGSMLDLSGGGSQRILDHRSITSEIDELDGGTNGMMQFMYATGAIRMNYNGGKSINFHWVVQPNYAQRRVIKDISSNMRYITIDNKGDVLEFDDSHNMIEQFRWY